MADNIATLDGVEILAAPVLFRDCAFPITDARRYCPPDDVLQNFPIFIGRWEDDMLAPAISSQEITIDASEVTGPCDTAIVTTELESCSLVAPNQKKIKLRTDTLDWTKLIAVFCKQRNISMAQLGTVILANGQFDLGNPYTPNFARFAMAAVSKALMRVVSRSILTGDFSNNFEVDGLYNQLTNGWANPQTGTPCDATINTRQTIDWGDLTGAESGPASPDDVTVEGTVTLWGNTYDVPAGLNLAGAVIVGIIVSQWMGEALVDVAEARSWLWLMVCVECASVCVLSYWVIGRVIRPVATLNEAPVQAFMSWNEVLRRRHSRKSPAGTEFLPPGVLAHTITS